MENINRDLKRREFVFGICGLKNAQIIPLVQDGSARIYFRVKNAGGKDYILMDDVSGKCKMPEFVKLADFLSNHGVRVPAVYFKDLHNGFLLLEDLGDNTFTKLLPDYDAEELYRLGTDLICKAASIKERPAGVPDMNRELVIKDICLFLEWYCPMVLGHPLDEKVRREFKDILTETIEMGFKFPLSLVLWDYHVDNLMMLPDSREGAVIDFQDAMWGPGIYDAVSLLEDARSEIPDEVTVKMKQRFYEKSEIRDKELFDDAWAFFSMHRHMRVLGRFTTLMACNQKTRYLQFIPRAWKLLAKTLDYPKLAKMKAWVNANLPEEFRREPKLKPINKAFMLAAGRGARMGELTSELPKPLIKVNGKALIDYNFDKIGALNIKDVMVNICYKGEQIRRHLDGRPGFEIVFSEEEEALETGGGVKKGLSWLENSPVVVLNSDTFWIDEGYKPAMWRLYDAWEDKYDVVLLLQPLDKIIGDKSIGDYKAENGRLIRNTEKLSGFPYMFAGVSVIHPRAFEHSPEGKFSLVKIFDKAAAVGKLGFVVNEGTLFHVGTPKALELAEKSA